MTENTENKEIDILELIKKLWSKRKLIITITAIAAVIGLVVGSSIPSEFTTTVKMAPEGQSSNKFSEMDGGLAALAGVNISKGGSDGISVMLYPEIVTSTPFIVDLSTIQVKGKKMEKEMSLFQYMEQEQKAPWWGYVMAVPIQVLNWTLSLFSEKQDTNTKDGPIDTYRLTMGQEGVLGAIKNRITVELDKKKRVMIASVNMQDAQISAIVADSMVNKLEKYIVKYRTEKAIKDYNFISQLFEDAKQKYYSAQSAYARYSDANQNVVKNSVLIEKKRLFDEQNMAFEIYSDMAQQKERTKIKVQEQTPTITIIEPAKIPTRRSGTSKLTILIAFAFLGGFASVGIIVFKDLFLKKNNA